MCTYVEEEEREGGGRREGEKGGEGREERGREEEGREERERGGRGRKNKGSGMTCMHKNKCVLQECTLGLLQDLVETFFTRECVYTNYGQ